MSVLHSQSTTQLPSCASAHREQMVLISFIIGRLSRYKAKLQLDQLVRDCYTLTPTQPEPTGAPIKEQRRVKKRNGLMSECLPGWVGASPPSYGGFSRPPRHPPSPASDSPSVGLWRQATGLWGLTRAETDLSWDKGEAEARGAVGSRSLTCTQPQRRAPDQSLQPAPLLEHHWFLPACHCCQGGKICS